MGVLGVNFPKKGVIWCKLGIGSNLGEHLPLKIDKTGICLPENENRGHAV